MPRMMASLVNPGKLPLVQPLKQQVIRIIYHVMMRANHRNPVK
jgi:hypothetical protein